MNKKVKTVLFFVIFISLVWIYRHFDTLTGNYFINKSQAEAISKSLSLHENVEMEELETEAHKNNPDYTFDIKKAEENAETDISKVIKDKTEYVTKENELYNAYPWADKYNVIKAYSVFNFKGDIVLDASDIGDEFKKNSVILVGPDNATIDRMEKCKYTVDGDKITVDYTITEPTGSYMIAVTENPPVFANAKAVVSNVTSNFKNAFKETIEFPDLENGNFLVRNYLLFRFFRQKPLMIMVSSGDEEVDKELKKYCLESAIHFSEADLSGFFGLNLTEKDIKVVSKARFIAQYKWLRLMYPHDEQIPYIEGYYSEKSYVEKYKGPYWVGYYTFSDLEDSINMTIARSKINNSPFSYEDTFRFKNFCSAISYGGNCAGIAYYAMKVFNNGEVETSGSFDFDNWKLYRMQHAGSAKGIVEWDIAKHAKNEFLHSGRNDLFRYNPTFDVDHTSRYKVTHLDGTTELYDLVNKDLEVYESEFVKMIGCHWAECNSKRASYEFKKDYGDYWDYELIEDVLKTIDQNKIVQISFTSTKSDSSKSAAHSVNAYHYEIIDDENIDLFIYDTNYSTVRHMLTDNQFKTWKDVYNREKRNCFADGTGFYTKGVTFQIMHIRKQTIGGRDVFLYDYNVCSDGSWLATNDPSLISSDDVSYNFTVNDENANFFNVKYQ